MRRWTTRLATAAALTLGLPAMNVAYGAGRPHRPASSMERMLGRLDRLGHSDIIVSGVGALRGVDVRARDDGWAVGGACVNRGCSRERTLIEHWNGRQWSRVPSPNATALQTLTSVSAVSGRDAWAVGGYVTRDDEAIRALIVHWNGTRWSRVPSPNPRASAANGINLLASVAAVSGGDAWAAGAAVSATVQRPLFLHWNGTRWSAVPSPRKTGNSQIGSVSAASARDIWAVGTYGDTTSHALVEHWNGTAWRIVAAPARPRGQVQLTAVTALSARSAWAVGAVCPDHCLSANPPSHSLILHWNGRRWAPAASPGTGAASALRGVSATSGASAWAVGEYCTKACTMEGLPVRQARLLFLHWDGTRWSRVAGPSLGRDVHLLEGVSALSRRSAWAVGETCTRNCTLASSGLPVTRPLTLHWNGRRWQSG